MIGNLSDEISKRREQYEHYHNTQIISSKHNNDCNWLKLGEISEITRGASPRPIKKYITDDPDGVNWIKIGDTTPGCKYVTTCKEKITKEGADHSRFVKKGDFILSNSMSFGRPYILDIDGCIHDGWLSISKFEKYVLPDYLYYVLTSEIIQNEFTNKASFGGAVHNLNIDSVKSVEIPIPSLKEQKIIIDHLDDLNKETTQLINNLEQEIEIRKQIYVYYLNKIMNVDCF